MGSSREDFSQGYQIVKDNFQKSAANLFVRQYDGTKCSNAIFITVLFCVLCRIQSLFAACRNLDGSPDECTVATAILKTLPEYSRLQKLVIRDGRRQTAAESATQSPALFSVVLSAVSL